MGPRTILFWLDKQSVAPLPGRTSVERCLVPWFSPATVLARQSRGSSPSTTTANCTSRYSRVQSPRTAIYSAIPPPEGIGCRSRWKLTRLGGCGNITVGA